VNFFEVRRAPHISYLGYAIESNSSDNSNGRIFLLPAPFCCKLEPEHAVHLPFLQQLAIHWNYARFFRRENWTRDTLFRSRSASPWSVPTHSHAADTAKVLALFLKLFFLFIFSTVLLICLIRKCFLNLRIVNIILIIFVIAVRLHAQLNVNFYVRFTASP